MRKKYNNKVSMLFCILFMACAIFRVSGGAIQGIPACAPYDYALTSSSVCSLTDGPLSPGSRTLAYTKHALDEFPCSGPENITLSNQSCECDLYEYRPLLQNGWQNTLCLNGRRSILSWNQSDSPGCRPNQMVLQQLNSQIGPESWLPCECTADDIASEYTDCESGDVRLEWGARTRMVVFFWKRLCVPGNLKLPRPSVIGCRDECDDGQFLGPPNTMCKDCPSGTYSVKGDVYGPIWKSIPSNFHTTCTGLGCHTWKVHNGVLESGDQNANDYASSILTLWADVKAAPSTLKVTYRTSTERAADFLRVYINGALVAMQSGIMPTWGEMTFNLQETGRDCKWTLSQSMLSQNVSKLCMVRNAFEPWRPEIHFNASVSPIYLKGYVADGDGCRVTAYNATAQGRLVFVRRDGLCHFDTKVKFAQAAGAAAVVVVDNLEAGVAIHMAGDSTGMMIPSVSMGKSDGERVINTIRQHDSYFFEIKAEDVNIGVQEINFVYVKDYSKSDGEDKVFIRDITITGTVYAAEQCTLCPPGRSSPKKSTECQPCPQDTYSDRPGVPWPCHPCPPHSHSAPGSTVCIPTDECTEFDYLPNLTRCVSIDGGATYTQQLKYVPVEPPSCNLTHSKYAPPLSRNITCGPCARGSVRKSDPLPTGPEETSQSCSQCPQGSIPKNLHECMPCATGMIAKRTLIYDGFRDLEGIIPKAWTLACTNCVGTGWNLVPATNITDSNEGLNTFLSTGHHSFGKYGFSVLTLPFTIEVRSNTSVTLGYHFESDPLFPSDLDAITVHFYIRVNSSTNIQKILFEASLIKTATRSLSGRLVAPALDPGAYNMLIFYVKRAQTNRPVSFVIRSLRIEGEASGGASKCEICPQGYSCSSGVPIACQPGFYGDELNSQTCKPCPGNTVSTSIAAKECLPCPVGTRSGAAHNICFIDQSFFMVLSPTRKRWLSYDLSFLDERIGPLSTKVNDTAPFSATIASEPNAVAMFLHLRTQSDTPGSQALPCSNIQGPYVCFAESDNKTTYNLGTVLSSVTSERRDAFRDDLVVQLTGGDRCDVRKEEFYRTSLRLICEDETQMGRLNPYGNNLSSVAQCAGLDLCKTMKTGSLYRFRLVEFDGCEAKDEIRTSAACPACTSVPYIVSYTTCDESGHKTEISTPSMTCRGGSATTSAVKVPCSWKDNVTQRHQSAVKLLISGGVVSLVVLLLLVAWLWVSRRKIYQSYQRLARSQAREEGMVAPGEGSSSSSPTGLDMEDADIRDAVPRNF